MEISRCTRVLPEDYKRNENSLLQKTSTFYYQSKTNADIKMDHTNITRNDCRNRKNDRSSGPGKSQQLGELSFSILSGTKDRWNPKTNFKSETTKSICDTHAIPVDITHSNSKLFATWGLGCKSGSISGVFPCPYRPSPQEIPKNSIPGINVPNDLPSFRTVLRTKDFFLTDELGGGTIEEERYSHNSIPRRFHVSCPVIINTGKPSANNPGIAKRTGLVGQREKISYNSLQTPRVFGNNVGPEQQPEISPTHKSRQDTFTSMPYTPNEKMDVTPSSSIIRLPKLCVFCHPVGATTLPTDSNSLQPGVAQKSEETNNRTSNDPPRNVVVEGCDIRKHSCTHPQSDGLSSNRCCRLRLGSNLKRPHFVRKMDTDSIEMALQQKGVTCNLQSHIAKYSRPKEQDLTGTIRQPDSVVLFKEAGGDKISSSVARGSCNIGVDTNPQCDLGDSTPARLSERNCRPFVKRMSSSGVASPPRGNRKYILKSGVSNDRPICLSKGTRNEEVLLSRYPGPKSRIPQCVQPHLEFPSSVAVSSTLSSPASFMSPQQRGRKIHFGGTKVEKDLLASGLDEEGVDGPNNNPQSAPRISGHDYEQSSSTHRGLNIGSLASAGWGDLLKDWSQNELKLLTRSWRPSTLSVYKPAWKRWFDWATMNNIVPHKPDSSDVAKYLAYLHLDLKLAYKTIMVQKSVISTFCEPHLKQKLSSDVIIRRILKSIQLENPAKVKCPTWDPRLLSDWLLKSAVSDISLFEASRRCATILLLASGRRVHDLTLLCVDQDNYIDNGDNIIFWPKFGSKTDSADHQQSGWKLLECPGSQNICPVFWIRQLLLLNENRRGNLKELFLAINGPVKPASRTVIASWVKTVLSSANIQATPGSSRAAVASLNWIQNMPLDQILSQGNWKQPNTFLKFYKKEVKHCNNESLSRLFNAV